MKTSARPQGDHGRGCTVATALLIISSLAACGDYSADYPALMPTDQVLAQPDLPAHAAGAARSPQAIEDSLTARAAHLAGGKAARPPATGAGAGGDLEARAAALQSRAAALARTPMGGDGPDCPEGAPDCPATDSGPAPH